MSEPTTVRMGALAAYLSLALALSAQGGAAIWWAGTQNTRLTSLEARVAELPRPAIVLQRDVDRVAVLALPLADRCCVCDIPRRCRRIGCSIQFCRHGVGFILAHLRGDTFGFIFLSNRNRAKPDEQGGHSGRLPDLFHYFLQSQCLTHIEPVRPGLCARVIRSGTATVQFRFP